MQVKRVLYTQVTVAGGRYQDSGTGIGLVHSAGA